MKFAVVGITHKEAKEDIRQYVAWMDTQKIECYDKLLQQGIMQAVVVATCNRSEIYVMVEDEKQIEVLYDLFCEVSKRDLKQYLFEKIGEEAIQYLFEVCLGYHSELIGEDQIEGQIQEAYAFACHMQACKKQMHRIFQNCFKTTKQIKTKYAINAHPVSLPYIAMRQWKQVMNLSNQTILIIGSGTMAKLFLTYAKQEPLKRIYLCSRHYQHAQDLQDDARIHILPFSNRYEIIPQCDVIVCATSSPHAILSDEHYPNPRKLQIIFDLAMPSDCEKQIQEKGVQLLTMQTLSAVKDQHIKYRISLLQEAHQDVIQGVKETQVWLDSEKLQETISSLQQKSEESALAAYEMIVSKISLNHHEQLVVKKILKSSFFRMVKEPMMALAKQTQEQETYIEMVKTLFQMEDRNEN